MHLLFDPWWLPWITGNCSFSSPLSHLHSCHQGLLSNHWLSSFKRQQELVHSTASEPSNLKSDLCGWRDGSQLRAHDALTEDQGLIPSMPQRPRFDCQYPRMAASNHLDSSSRDLTPSSGLLGKRHKWTHTGKAFIYKKWFFKTWLLAPDTSKVHREVGLCSNAEFLHKEVSEMRSFYFKLFLR